MAPDEQAIGTRWRPRKETIFPPIMFTALEGTFNGHLMFAYLSHGTGTAYWVPQSETLTHDRNIRMAPNLKEALSAAEHWAKEN